MSPALLLSACLARTVLGAVDASYVLELRSEVRERTLSYPDSAPSTFEEVWLQPGLELRLSDPRLETTLTYRPELTYYDQTGPQLAVLHRASLVGQARLDPRWNLSGAAHGSFGSASTVQIAGSGPGAPPGSPPAPGQPIPTVGFIQYVNGLVALGVDGMAAPALRLRASAEAFVDGGADAAAQAQLPLEWGGRLIGGLDWTASPRSLLSTEVRGSTTRLDGGWEAFIGRLTETLRFTASGQVTLQAGAGVTWSSSRVDGQAHEDVRPSLLAGLIVEAGVETLRFHSNTVLASEPVVDRSTALVANRATAGTVNILTIDPRWRFELSGSGGVMTDGPQARDTNWSAEGRVVLMGRPIWEVSAGGRAIWSRYHVDQSGSSDWSVFLGLLLRDSGHL